MPLFAPPELTANDHEVLALIADHAGLPARCVDPLTFCMSGRILRDRTYRQLLPAISDNLASRDLNELVKAGLLTAIGERRGRRYVAAEPMRDSAMEIVAGIGDNLDLDRDPYREVDA
jgi:hypothetical protein